MDDTDWLNDPALSAVSVTDPGKATQAKEFSQLYRVFADDERGRQLLAHWDKTLRRKRVPAGASLQEYAAIEAVRDFIQSIQDQIEFSHTQG